jgi:hypothetical protein
MQTKTKQYDNGDGNSEGKKEQLSLMTTLIPEE